MTIGAATRVFSAVIDRVGAAARSCFRPIGGVGAARSFFRLIGAATRSLFGAGDPLGVSEEVEEVDEEGRVEARGVVMGMEEAECEELMVPVACTLLFFLFSS